MRFTPQKIALYFFALAVTTIVGCSKFNIGGNGERQVSRFSEDESHEQGRICADCHYQVGNGEGSFTLAGTAYGNTNRATVELYTGPFGSGNLIKTIEVDRLGNFYTTESISFTGGLFAAVKKNNGSIEYMEDPIVYGQCNICHGNTTDKLEL